MTKLAMERSVRIPVADRVTVEGDLAVPEGATGLVVFAHGSGSSRHSPRNRAVAAGLRDRGLGTLLVDLLTPEEEAADDRTGRLRFDIDLLAGRLEAAAAWLATRDEARGLGLGYFGASTGAAAALVAASRHPEGVRAIVSRGGRPDLAGDRLEHVRAPTLLIVGGRDEIVIELNREAHRRLRVERRLEIVPGATHLFEEPGAIEAVARLAGDWFEHHLAAPDRASEGARL